MCYGHVMVRKCTVHDKENAECNTSTDNLTCSKCRQYSAKNDNYNNLYPFGSDTFCCKYNVVMQCYVARCDVCHFTSTIKIHDEQLIVN